MKYKIKVTGSDARSFLNRILTNDILHLKTGERNYNCLCSNKGKILADLYCEAEEKGFLLFFDASLTHKILDCIQKYIIADDVEVREEGADSTTEPSPAERIEQFIPKYGIDFDENNIPQEAGLHHALNFEKGCYVGQETIARLHFRGHVNKFLCQFIITGQTVPEPQSKILNKEKIEIGFVTSSAWSPLYKSPVALGYLKYAYKDETEFWITSNMAKRLQKIPLK